MPYVNSIVVGSVTMRAAPTLKQALTIQTTTIAATEGSELATCAHESERLLEIVYG
eukprot:m.64584 g.64584  ORF g.64584 m.64584 type:complete len:56 (-) comp14007_c0_seq4:9-176(-)